MAGHNYYPGVKRLVETWERIYGLYGPVHIDISGGEPFFYPDFLEFIPALATRHSMAINTNLSFDVKELIDKVRDNRDRIRLNATFHPLFGYFPAILPV